MDLPPRKLSVAFAVVALTATLLPLASDTAVAAPIPGTFAALQFNGTNQYVTFGAAPSLGLAQFTLETWFNKAPTGGATTSTGNGGVVAYPLVTKGRAEAEGTNVDMNYFLGIDASNHLVADFEEGVGGTGPLGLNHPITGSAVISNSVWHHAAATYDGTTWKLYLDGVLDGTLAVGQPPRSDSIQHADLGTAMTSTGVAAGFFNGAIDEARIWNQARSQVQIQGSKDSELTSGTGLVARWGMNEGTGTTVGNSIGGGVNGTAVGTPTWVDGFVPPVPAACLPNCALQFNGTNQYVTFGAAPSLGLAQFTLETWFNKAPTGGATTSTGNGGVVAYPLVTKGRAEAEGTNVDMNYFLGIDASNHLVADFEEGVGGTGPLGLNHPITGSAVISNSVWHHAAATYDGTTWKLYLDGVLDGTLAVGQPPRSDSIQHADLGTAMTSTGVAAGFFNGAIDEARIWNQARSQVQIQGSKDSELTSGTGLVARWGMNEGTGTTVGNSIGGGVNGTAVGAPTWANGFVPPASPPNAPVLNTPTDGATGTGTSPTLDVTVTDPGSHDLDVIFYGRPFKSGTFAPIATSEDVASGDHATTPWSGLDAGQAYEWYVTVNNASAVTTGPTWTFRTADGADPIFVGAGDISDCGNTDDTATGNIMLGVAGTVFTTGDNVYPWGSAANYTNCYGPTPWGDPSVLSRTRPIPGNHDWGTDQVPSGTETLANYFAYYGANSQGAGGTSYYSYDINSHWYVVNLDSECQLVPGGCGVGSPQELWLKADLAANSSKNVIALWHKPRYSSSVTTDTEMQPFWDDLYDAGVDILLVGHDHVYERLAPMKSGANLSSPPVADPSFGIRQFTVGTGGDSHLPWGTTLATSEVRNNDTYGVLRLTLHASTYDWRYLPVAGGTFTDSGTSTVHGAPGGGGGAAPDAPTLVAPTDGAADQGLPPSLDVSVSDPDNDPLTVTFHGRPTASGMFQTVDTWTNIASGSEVVSPWPNLGRGQGYQWYVTVDDGTHVTTGPTWTFSTVASTDPVFVGVGDIGSCTSSGDEATAPIIAAIQGDIWTTGDNVYPNGTASEFTNCYDPSWGAPGIKSRTRPIPGNHDWGAGVTNNLNGYFGYYGAAATDGGGKSYYSYDIGSNWHVVNLDSECELVPGGCDVGSPQELWLQADLADNSGKNVIALWHKPRFSSGVTNYTPVQPFVDDLYAAGADLVLVGHDHVYERQQPLDPNGNADASYGISYFTVGTGGESHHPTGSLRPTSQVLNNDTYGIMKFTLHANSYDWQFFPEAGKTFTDSGTRLVHGAPVSASPAKDDFNADGRSDLAWRNTSTGEDYLWFMNGTQIGSSGPSLTLPDQAWKVFGTGDYDGDGHADLLWRNTSTGEVYVWLMNGTTVSSHGSVFVLSDLSWKIVGTGDFNGDGRSDVLWRNSSTGENYLWFMNGTTLGSSGALLTLSDLAWKVVGTGDFNGDAKTDIAWQNASTGQVYVWLMDGTTLASHGAVFTLGDPNWVLAGTGDYDGNGKDDLLWRNSSTGENYLWFMNGTTLGSSGATLTLADQAWKVSGTGDYDGNAKADIAWRNTSTGEVYVWLMDSTTLASHGSTFTLGDPAWQIVPANPPAGALYRAAAAPGTGMSFTVSRRGAPKLTAHGKIHRWWHRSTSSGPRTVRPTPGEMTWSVKKTRA